MKRTISAALHANLALAAIGMSPSIIVIDPGEEKGDWSPEAAAVAADKDLREALAGKRVASTAQNAEPSTLTRQQRRALMRKERKHG